MPVDEDAPCLPGVFRHVVTQADKFHIAGKPPGLMCDLLRIIRTGRVLDPFMGSGTTGMAAVYNGLEFIGIEREEVHLQIAQTRIAEVQAGGRGRMAVSADRQLSLLEATA